MSRSTSSPSSSRTSTVDDVTQQSRETGMQVTDQVREQASNRLSSQKDRAAGGLHSMADAIKKTGDQLQEQNPSIAQFTSSAADRIEQFAGRLETEDIGQLMDDVERFARRRPALFLGGTFALGLLAARFLKSSEPDRFEGGMNYDRYYAGRGTYTSYQGAGYDAEMSRGYGSASGSPAVRGTPSVTSDPPSASDFGRTTDGAD